MPSQEPDDSPGRVADPIPLDVVISIIDDLAVSKDYRSLQCFSLVCRNLLPTCQRHIFRVLDVVGFIGHKALLLARFHHAITSNPYLATYVQVINIEVFYDPLINISYLPSVMEVIPALHTFKLDFVGRRMGWTELAPRFTQALYRIFQLPTFSSLSLTSVGAVPASLFQCCPNLKALHLEHVTISHGTDSAPKPPRIFLQELRVPTFQTDESDYYRDGLLLCFGITHLQKLTTKWASSHKTTWDMIERARSTLRCLSFTQESVDKDLEIDDPPDPDTINGQLDTPRRIFQSLSRLRAFEFKVVISPQEDVLSPPTIVHHPFYPWWELLQEGPKTLQRIAIFLDLSSLPSGAVLWWFKPSSSILWAEIDSIFSNNNTLPVLSLVVVAITIPESSDDSDESESSEDDMIERVIGLTNRRFRGTRRRAIDFQVLVEVA